VSDELLWVDYTTVTVSALLFGRFDDFSRQVVAFGIEFGID
jgi:hypothetical protein